MASRFTRPAAGVVYENVYVPLPGMGLICHRPDLLMVTLIHGQAQSVYPVLLPDFVCSFPGTVGIA